MQSEDSREVSSPVLFTSNQDTSRESIAWKTSRRSLATIRCPESVNSQLRKKPATPDTIESATTSSAARFRAPRSFAVVASITPPRYCGMRTAASEDTPRNTKPTARRHVSG